MKSKYFLPSTLATKWINRLDALCFQSGKIVSAKLRHPQTLSLMTKSFRRSFREHSHQLAFLITATASYHLVSAQINFIRLELTVDQHLKGKDLDQPLSFLVGFRQYMHYHLHAMKTQLHSRMRKRVEIFERVINMAKRDKEGPKNWKETHGGIS